MQHRNPKSPAVRNPLSAYAPGLIDFVATFVHDLDVSPTTNEEDTAAIEKLIWSLKASSIRIWARRKFPKLTEYLKAPGLYPGRRLCAIHNNMATTCLFNLHDLIMDEVKVPAESFCHPGLGNHYLSTFEDLNRIWNKEYQNTSNLVTTQLRRPLTNHQLFQETNCAGCCLRRMLSDPNIVAVLIVAVRFKELEYLTLGMELLDYLEVAWYLLSEKLPHVQGSKVEAIRAREELETEARRLSHWSRSPAFKKSFVGRVEHSSG